MRPRWRLRDAMETVAVVAIYLAALHSLTLGPSGDPFTIWQRLVSIVLLVFIMPFPSRCSGPRPGAALVVLS